MTPTKSVRVLVAGGGVAALETVLGLRETAGGTTDVTLLAPSDVFVYRPWEVVTPLGKRIARRLSLRDFCDEMGVSFQQDSLASVDLARRLAETGAGKQLHYATLVVAVGATAGAVPAGMVSLGGPEAKEGVAGLMDDIERGAVSSLAIVVPSAGTWPLPAYEVALLLRHCAIERHARLAITILTAEASPLAVFGDAASTAVARALAKADIEIATDAGAQISALFQNDSVAAAAAFQKILVVPALHGPAIPGLPADANGFIPVTDTGEVEGAPAVFAAGDGTSYPVKQGGVAAQQADRIVAAIATGTGETGMHEQHGLDIHGMLLTGRRQHQSTYLYISARVENGVARDSRVSDRPTWSPPAKIAARYLAPYLDTVWGVAEPGVADWHAWSYTESAAAETN
jgi:sulfide:quinone oxidoreductase